MFGLMGLNPYLCRLPVHFDLSHLLFIACDVSFYFLGKYLISGQQMINGKAAKSA